MYFEKRARPGQAMLLTILTLGGAILGATTIAGLLMIYQIRQTTDSENSAKAIFAADAGIECSLYDYFQSGGSSLPTPLGYWPFEEGAGNAVGDSSGNGHNGTWIGTGAHWGPGKVGSFSGQFNGINDDVDVGVLGASGNNFTFTGWISPAVIEPGFAGVMYSRASSQPIGVDFGGSGNHLTYTWNNNSALTWGWLGGPIVPVGQWSFFAVVIDPVQTTIYLSPGGGPMVSAVNAVPNIPQTFNGAMLFGQDLGARFFNGSMDDLRIYNTALSAAQVAALAGAAPPPVACPLTFTLTNNSHYTSTIDLAANIIFSQGLSGTARRSFLFFLSSATTTAP